MMMMMMRPKSARRHCSYKSAGNSAVFIAHTIFPASDGFALSLCSSELSHILGRCCCRVAKEQYGRRRRGKEKKRRKPSTHKKKYKPSSAFDCVLLIWLPLVFFLFVSCCDESVGRISFMSSTSLRCCCCAGVWAARPQPKIFCYICKFHNACMQLFSSSGSYFLAQLREQNFNISHISAHKLSWYFLSIFTIAPFPLCLENEELN